MPVDAKKDTREVFQDDADELHATTTPDPAGPPTIVEQPDATKLKATVTQAAKDRTVTGNVGVLDSLDTRINPAKEDGNLASIKTNTDNLNITQSSFRDAIRGANTKDFSTLEADIESIKDTDGIKKITDPVTVIQPVAANLKATVTQAEKDRTVTGNVGVLDSLDARINPAKEDGNLATIKTNTDNLDITQSSFRDAIRGANTKDFSTIQTTIDSIKDTDGIKKITDAVTVIQPDETKLKATVTQAAKDRTITGNVGVLDSLDARINPSKEDGNLASIKTNTDNLNITQSSLRDAIQGAATKDFSTIQTTIDSIKDTDGIKKITDAVTIIQENAALLKATVTQAAKDRTVTNAIYANLKGQVKITDETNFMPTMDTYGRRGFVELAHQWGIFGISEIPPLLDPMGGTISIGGKGHLSAVIPMRWDAPLEDWYAFTKATFTDPDYNVITDGEGHDLPTMDVAARKGFVQPTDGTNLMPMMDVAARKGFMQPTDGTNLMPMMDNYLRRGYVTICDWAGAVMPVMDTVGRAGFQKLTDGTNVVDTVKDNITGRSSILVSRGHGRNTITVEFEASQGPIALITPNAGKKIDVCGVLSSSDGTTGEIQLDFITSAQRVWRHYISTFASFVSSDMHIEGNADEVLTVTTTQGAKDAFILVNYREVD